LRKVLSPSLAVLAEPCDQCARHARNVGGGRRVAAVVDVVVPAALQRVDDAGHGLDGDVAGEVPAAIGGRDSRNDTDEGDFRAGNGDARPLVARRGVANLEDSRGVVRDPCDAEDGVLLEDQVLVAAAVVQLVEALESNSRRQ
jgi:hypothetical protein